MFNCDHCQKKYKRSWHQARHSQMKHENSNASTATTSSAGTPPTPEINGNIPNNNNYNYQHLQQVPQMPSQPIVQDLNQIAPSHTQQQQSVTIPPATNTWNPMSHPQQQQHHTNYAASNELLDTKAYNVQQPVEQVHNGEYANYVVNEQYSNKFEQVQPTPVAVNPVYDSWVRKNRFDCRLTDLTLCFLLRILNRHHHHLGITIISLTCNPCIIRLSLNNRNQTNGIMTLIITSINLTGYTTMLITIKLISIALTNHQHQFIQARIHRFTITV